MEQPSGTSQSEHATPKDAGAQHDPRALDRLGNTGEGCFAVRTMTGSYLIDLTERRLVRCPVTLTSPGKSLKWTFDVDGAWLPLVRLLECAVGNPMRATLRIHGEEQPLRTSPVQAIASAGADPSPGG